MNILIYSVGEGYTQSAALATLFDQNLVVMWMGRGGAGLALGGRYFPGLPPPPCLLPPCAYTCTLETQLMIWTKA